MSDHSLVRIKRRTIVVWAWAFGTKQTMPLNNEELAVELAGGKEFGWKLLYLVRCRPRVRR